MPPCKHTHLRTNPSDHAVEAGYRQLPLAQLVTAATDHGNSAKALAKPMLNPSDWYPANPTTKIFPAPLVLPDDDLACGPDYEPQSLRSWVEEPYRNEVTKRRNKLYIAAPPEIPQDVSFLHAWTKPNDQTTGETAIPMPQMQHLIDYLAAFYHGLPVSPYSTPFRFTTWNDDDASHIGLAAGTTVIRIRTRPSNDNLYSLQLNLTDLLDAAIAFLPPDAYAMALLLHHDMYEDEDDDFACGRAYGGSRVAVVSTARYNPSLDAVQAVERLHAWPLAHCDTYMRRMAGKAKRASRTPAADFGNIATATDGDAPLAAAARAYGGLPPLSGTSSPETLAGLWLARVCRTTAHELGHCFGMDHCVYYACSMQGTTSLSEDMRQPPYLCPVDLAKMLWATGADARGRYEALLRFCERHGHVHMFAAFGAWIRGTLASMGGSGLGASAEDPILVD